MSPKDFASVIKQALKESGLSLRSFAKECSLDSSYLSKVLKGKRNPPAEEDAIAKVADFINMPHERLMFICGRIPSRLQGIFLREDIFEILEDLSAKASKRPGTRKSPGAVPAKSVYKRQNIPDEIL